LGKILDKRRSLRSEIELLRRMNKEQEEKINRMQSLANMGLASSMIAHEMNNLLVPVMNYAQLAGSNVNDTKMVNKALQKISDNSHRAGKVIKGILAMANGSSGTRSICRLSELVEQVFDCLARDFNKDGIKVNIDIESSLKVEVERTAFQQVIMNLILNARDAMLGRGGKLTVDAEYDQQNNKLRVSVSDTGKGIQPGDRERIFDLFYSTKDETGRARGLGLAFCKRVVEAHNGSIIVSSKIDRGTVFTIIIDAAEIMHKKTGNSDTSVSTVENNSLQGELTGRKHIGPSG
jgi:signal transduction histidine kinase